MPSTAKVIVELDIEGDPEEAFHVVDSLLDAGILQDAINDHDCDVGEVHVLSATCRAENDEAPSSDPDEIRPVIDAQMLAELISGAKEHGNASEPEHEVGDLEAILHSCWLRLTSEQRREVYTAHHDVVAWKEGG